MWFPSFQASLLLLLLAVIADTVEVAVDRTDRRLLVDGRRFFARGVCYAPVPVGLEPTDWLGPDEPARSVWMEDLALMKAMGMNSLRVYELSPTIDHKPFLDACLAHGILVAIMMDWAASVDLSSAADRAHWTAKLVTLVQKYKGHPAVLMWGFGNERNHHADTDEQRRQHLTLVTEARAAVHTEEARTGHWHPLCTTLMDLHLDEYFALESSFPEAVDLWCLQLYRGPSFRSSLFAMYPSSLPMLITEYGADAWDHAAGRLWPAGLHDEQRNALVSKSRELRDWRSVVAGGMIFSFQDEWWKCPGSPDVHDHCSVGQFGGLSDEQANDEWWGLYATAPGPVPQARIPRGAVEALTQLWSEVSFSAVMRIMPDADTYVCKWEDKSQHGSKESIATKYHSWSPGSGLAGQSLWNEMGVLRFPGVPPASCRNARATVEVFVRWLTADSIPVAYGPLKELAWDESSVSWNSLKVDHTIRRTINLTRADVFQKVTLDVDGWWSLGEPFGLWLQPDDTVAENNDQQAGFYSHESHFGPPELAVACDKSWAEEGWYGFDDSASSSSTSTTTSTSWVSGGNYTSSTSRMPGANSSTITTTSTNTSTTTGTRTTSQIINVTRMTTSLPSSSASSSSSSSSSASSAPTFPTSSSNTTRVSLSTVMRIMPDADTYVGKWEDKSEHGSKEFIATKYHSWKPGSWSAGQSLWNEVGILRFPGVPPASCRNAHAEVEVFMRWLTADSILMAYGPLKELAWDEYSVSWNNLKVDQSIRRTINLKRADVFKKVTLDVDGWWSLGEPFGLWLQPDDTVAENNDQQAGFYSRESHFGPPDLALACDKIEASESFVPDTSRDKEAFLDLRASGSSRPVQLWSAWMAFFCIVSLIGRLA